MYKQDMKYCTYITIYRGNKLPPFYIGSSSIKLIDRGYRGSVRSREYKKTWASELRDNPALFTTRVIRTFGTREEATDYEHVVQKALGVTTNPLYVNKSLARDFKSLRRGVRLTQEQKKKISEGQRGHRSYEKQRESVRRMSAREWIVTKPDGTEIEVYNLSAFARENGGLNVANMINVSSKGYRARLKDPSQVGMAKGPKKTDKWKKSASEITRKRWENKRTHGFSEFLTTVKIPDHVEFVLDIGSNRTNEGRGEWETARKLEKTQYRVHLHEWINRREIVESMIRAKAGQSERLFARKLKLNEISAQEARRFHEANHVSGPGNPSLAFSLGNEAVMSFTRSRYDGYEWELNRFSSRVGVTVVGGASRLFSRFLEHVSPSSVVSFADLRWGSGSVYEKLGFSLNKLGPPTYWYFHPDHPLRFSRMTFQKGKLENKLASFDPMLSEVENMRRNGYVRYWDCGSAEYSWNLTVS